MSSTYQAICLDHNPPIVVVSDDTQYSAPELPARLAGHENCQTAVGRYSYPLIEIWLPTPYLDREGSHPGRWYDVSWMNRFPAVARAILDGQL